MDNFKNFTEKISCRVIPITRDRHVWLDEKVVDDDSYCAFINGRSYELGEEYNDFLHVTADNFAELADVILRPRPLRCLSATIAATISSGNV